MLNAIMLSVIMLRDMAPYSTFYSNASNTSKYSKASIQYINDVTTTIMKIIYNKNLIFDLV